MEIFMKNYLENFFCKFDYPKEAADVLTDAYEKIVNSPLTNTKFTALLSEYSKSYDMDYKLALSEMNSVSESVGIHPYTGALLLFICFSKQLERYYKAAGLDDDIFTASVKDLKYKLFECKCVHGVWGSFVAHWFKGFFNMTRFGLGKLQFEIIDFKAEYEKDGVKLTPDSKVINVHIPRTGGRLDEESRKEAYDMAASFFAPQLGDGPVVFVCHSWFLFPKHKEILKPTSNLMAFISDYDTFVSGYYETYTELYHVFDIMYTGDISKLPADTSLRRAYIKMLENGERTGWGRGVYVYKK